ncbi:MAG: hypothetical protein AUK52_08345 [Comamonadaceae bacterium CG2_30_60_41]|nr:MAG: hypothetical protein AUK52_08345 [Comamonadaceae bacterium CG2_30_60_41]
MNRYLTQWFLATALILLAVAAINVVVDPYGIFRLVKALASETAASAQPTLRGYSPTLRHCEPLAARQSMGP